MGHKWGPSGLIERGGKGWLYYSPCKWCCMASIDSIIFPPITGRTVQVSRGHGEFGFTLNGNAPVCIRSIDSGGVAEGAGLQPGDQILQLNGVHVRSVGGCGLILNNL